MMSQKAAAISIQHAQSVLEEQSTGTEMRLTTDNFHIPQTESQN